MNKRSISAFILIAYCAFLFNLLVFKFDLFQIGGLRLKLSAKTGQPNFIPFKTILPYLLGGSGWFINLVGNIVLFAPIGFLFPYIYRKVTWQKSLVLAIASGLVIEVMEVLFHVGIFDIDDIILNGLGVMIGYWLFTRFIKTAS